ncbi:hypothetical protein A3860_24685 [Niastella vici]|uniref:Uncharacterized protein n=1 Tax=Niastella vici TaxID=1703345 RepID=A0A1V9FYZ0_9BACT|nr:hypothetical protein A3860_24685 [Niastella vici]
MVKYFIYLQERKMAESGVQITAFKTLSAKKALSTQPRMRKEKTQKFRLLPFSLNQVLLLIWGYPGFTPGPGLVRISFADFPYIFRTCLVYVPYISRSFKGTKHVWNTCRTCI